MLSTLEHLQITAQFEGKAQRGQQAITSCFNNKYIQSTEHSSKPYKAKGEAHPRSPSSSPAELQVLSKKLRVPSEQINLNREMIELHPYMHDPPTARSLKTYQQATRLNEGHPRQGTQVKSARVFPTHTEQSQALDQARQSRKIRPREPTWAPDNPSRPISLQPRSLTSSSAHGTLTQFSSGTSHELTITSRPSCFDMDTPQQASSLSSSMHGLLNQNQGITGHKSNS